MGKFSIDGWRLNPLLKAVPPPCSRAVIADGPAQLPSIASWRARTRGSPSPLPSRFLRLAVNKVEASWQEMRSLRLIGDRLLAAHHRGPRRRPRPAVRPAISPSVCRPARTSCWRWSTPSCSDVAARRQCPGVPAAAGAWPPSRSTGRIMPPTSGPSSAPKTSGGRAGHGAEPKYLRNHADVILVYADTCVICAEVSLDDYSRRSPRCRTPAASPRCDGEHRRPLRSADWFVRRSTMFPQALPQPAAARAGAVRRGDDPRPWPAGSSSRMTTRLPPPDRPLPSGVRGTRKRCPTAARRLRRS